MDRAARKRRQKKNKDTTVEREAKKRGHLAGNRLRVKLDITPRIKEGLNAFANLDPEKVVTSKTNLLEEKTPTNKS